MISWVGLVQAFHAMPNSITFLGLKRNELSQKSTDELRSIFFSIPMHVTTLDLSENCYIYHIRDNFIQALPEIVASVSTLMLTYIGGHTDALIRMIQAIPATVTSLHLIQDG